MGETPRVGWIVDVQNDFMRPDGRLYVRDLGDPRDPGAASLVEGLRKALGWMREHCALIVYTGDWHGVEDPEIDPVSPDPERGTYPPHCMGRSPDPAEAEGAWIIQEIRPGDPLVLEVDAGPAQGRALALQALEEGRPVFIRKTRFDVFAGNAGTEAFVETLRERLGPDLEFLAAGVARDVCVTQAVDGLQERGLKVTALNELTWGLGLEPEKETLARWARKGRVLSSRDLLEGS